jgi:hypothetical protein
MTFEQDRTGDGRDEELAQALTHFKASIDAWSDAALSRPRTAVRVAAQHSWRMAASWALGCVLALGSLTGMLLDMRHRQELAKLAAQQAAQKAAEARVAAGRAAALEASVQLDKNAPATASVREEAGAQDETLMATVDSDVSQQVPAAMEPLAELMDESNSQ